MTNPEAERSPAETVARRKLEVVDSDELLGLDNETLDEKSSEAKLKTGGNQGSMKIHYWDRVVVMTFWHCLALAGLFFVPGARWQTLVHSVVFYSFAVLGITAAAHRLWSHRSYKVKFPLKLFLLWTNCISNQLSVIEWVRDHRIHHKFSDTDADPHNPSRGFVYSHVGWIMCKRHPSAIEKGRKIDISDVKGDPLLVFQHRHFNKLCYLFSMILPTAVPVLMWQETLVTSFLVSFVLRDQLSNHAIWGINSFAHLWGARPYDKRMGPSENLFISLVAGGEGWHNYHHTFPHDYSAGEFNFRVNLTTNFIDLMALLGQAYDCKKISKEAIQRRKERTGE